MHIPQHQPGDKLHITNEGGRGREREKGERGREKKGGKEREGRRGREGVQGRRERLMKTTDIMMVLGFL